MEYYSQQKRLDVKLFSMLDQVFEFAYNPY
jgi:hypothetical protein